MISRILANSQLHLITASESSQRCWSQLEIKARRFWKRTLKLDTLTKDQHLSNRTNQNILSSIRDNILSRREEN